MFEMKRDYNESVWFSVLVHSGKKRTSYRGWTAEPARTWVSRRWSRTLFSERRRGPAGGQTWSSVDLWVVVFYVSLTFLLLLSVVLLSFFGLSSSASQVCGQPVVRTLGWFKKDSVLGVFFVDWACVSADSHLCLGFFYIQTDLVVPLLVSSRSPAHTRTHSDVRGAQRRLFGFGRINKATSGYPHRTIHTEGDWTVGDISYDCNHVRLVQQMFLSQLLSAGCITDTIRLHLLCAGSCA